MPLNCARCPGASAATLADASCSFDDAFAKQLAVSVTDRCMQRFVAPAFDAVVPLAAVAAAASVRLQDGDVLPGGVATFRINTLPVYVLHAPSVAKIAYRKQMMLERVRKLQPPDLTIVECLDRRVIASFSPVERECLYVPTPNPFDPLHPVLSNGTLSLAMKQKAAYLDIWQRGLDAAIVLEDDANVRDSLWKTLRGYRIPQDAQIFYLGSYTGSPTWNVLRYEWSVNGTRSPYKVHPHICKKNSNCPGAKDAKMFGAVAHIAFAQGARALLRTIRVAADVGFSVLPCPGSEHQPVAGPHPCAFCMPLGTRAYGPHTWLVTPDGRYRNFSYKGGSHLDSPGMENTVVPRRRALAQHDDNPAPSVLLAWVGLIRSAEMARISHAALQDTILDVARLDVAVFTDPDTSVCTRNIKPRGSCGCNRPFNITSTMVELWGDRLLAVKLVRIADLMARALEKQHIYARIRIDRGAVTMGAGFMWRLLDAWQSHLQRLSRGYDHLLMMRPDVELMKPLSPLIVCAARPGVYHLIGGNIQNSGLNFFWSRDHDWASLACAPAGLGHWLSYWQEAREPADVARELGLPCPPPLPRDEQNRTLFIGRAWTKRACAPSCPLCHDVTLAFLQLMNASMGPSNLDERQIFVRLLRNRYACDGETLVVHAESNHDVPACMPDRCLMYSIRKGGLHQACGNCSSMT